MKRYIFLILYCYSISTVLSQGGYIKTYFIKFNDRGDTNYFPHALIGLNIVNDSLHSFFYSTDTTRKEPYGTGFGVFNLNGDLLDYRSIPYQGEQNYFFPEGMLGLGGAYFFTSVHFSATTEAILKYHPRSGKVDTFTIRNSQCDTCSVRFGAMAMDLQGNLLLIHNIPNPAELNPVYSSVQMTKMDTSGRVIWQKIIGGGPLNPFLHGGIGKPVHRMLNRGHSVYIDDEGYYYAGIGYMNKYNYYQTLFYKISPDGEVIKQYSSLPGQKMGSVYAISRTTDGNIFISTEKCDNPGATYDFFSISSPVISILDKNLSLVKSFQLGYNGHGHHDVAYTKLVKSNEGDGMVLLGNFPFTFYYSRYDSSLMDTMQIRSFVRKISFCKINNKGDSLWHRIYRIREDKITHWSDAEESIGYDMKALTDGSGYLIGGYSYRDNSLEKLGEPYYMPLLIRVDNEGCIIPGCHLINGSGEDEKKKEPGFRSWPNPFNDWLVIQQDESKKLLYRIYRLDGGLMDEFDGAEMGENTILRTGEWQAGIYFLVVKDQLGNVRTEKLIKD